MCNPDENGNSNYGKWMMIKCPKKDGKIKVLDVSYEFIKIRRYKY